jgi:hypothetical protein
MLTLRTKQYQTTTRLVAVLFLICSSFRCCVHWAILTHKTTTPLARPRFAVQSSRPFVDSVPGFHHPALVDNGHRFVISMRLKLVDRMTNIFIEHGAFCQRKRLYFVKTSLRRGPPCYCQFVMVSRLPRLAALMFRWLPISFWRTVPGNNGTPTEHCDTETSTTRQQMFGVC